MPLAFEAASVAGEAGAALASTIVRATQDLDKHNKILDEQTMLHISEPNVGDSLLQYGYLVCLSEELEDDRKIHLYNLRKVVHADGAEFNECDYVVVEVS